MTSTRPAETRVEADAGLESIRVRSEGRLAKAERANPLYARVLRGLSSADWFAVAREQHVLLRTLATADAAVSAALGALRSMAQNEGWPPGTAALSVMTELEHTRAELKTRLVELLRPVNPDAAGLELGPLLDLLAQSAGVAEPDELRVREAWKKLERRNQFFRWTPLLTVPVVVAVFAAASEHTQALGAVAIGMAAGVCLLAAIAMSSRLISGHCPKCGLDLVGGDVAGPKEPGSTQPQPGAGGEPPGVVRDLFGRLWAVDYCRHCGHSRPRDTF